VSEPKIHRYKTFVLRGINGIPIQGNRAVITHQLDGSFQRALVKWPPLAAAGHKLATTLTVAEIEQRAAAALRDAGESSGAVPLRWKYVPTLLDSGEITLELVASARVKSKQHEKFTEEPREIDVPVDAR